MLYTMKNYERAVGVAYGSFVCGVTRHRKSARGGSGGERFCERVLPFECVAENAHSVL